MFAPEQTHLTPSLTSLFLLWGVVFLFVFLGNLAATGTVDLQSPDADPVMLLIGDNNFGNFASYSAPDANQLRVRIGESGESIYFGFAMAYNYDGNPRENGVFYYRVRRVSDGAIVHGPILINYQSANLADYDAALAGPEALNAGGYPTTDDFIYTAEEPGDYSIEFSSQLRYLGLWDISVGQNGQEKPGRVYSKNWAFRVPTSDPQLPDCVWGAQLSTTFYSYTSDGFVTQIDFTDSGFQPLSFNLAFNRTGPGNSGNLQLDRMSVPNLNVTDNSAEHLVFLEEPDNQEFPDGTCGDLYVADQLQCAGDGFCIPVSVTVPGQVEVVLDFNGNQVFDDGIDRILIHVFEDEQPLEYCLYWDGLLGDGTLPAADQYVNILSSYTQGVQHWALYDGEKMINGFCVEPVRPICGIGGNANLYYDDRNINTPSGTSANNDGRQGCDCISPDCRTWTNFDAGTNDCSDINDELTSGYGDKNTLNTWWFATIEHQASLEVPISLSSISASPEQSCPDSLLTLTLSYFSTAPIQNIAWSGPSDFSQSGQDLTSVIVSEPGLYTVVVIDTLGCESISQYLLEPIQCTMTSEVASVMCDNAGTDVDPSDDLFYAQIVINAGLSDQWVSDDGSITGIYGQPFDVGPYPIADGPVTLTIIDSEFDCCMLEIEITPPATCSDGCSISQTLIENNTCNDNGTPFDEEDDTFTFELTLDGFNLGENWVSNEGQTGLYGQAVTFGPYLISEGVRTIHFVDDGDAECTVSVVITPPETCSNQCLFGPVEVSTTCFDNQSPTNPFDDLFTVVLNVPAINGTSAAYEVVGRTIGIYGVPQEIGIFSIADGPLEFIIEDIVNRECRQTITVDPPAPCSNECGVEIVSIASVCNDGGTPNDIADDVFVYEILVNSNSPTNTTWIASDGTSGEYGVITTSQPLPISTEPIIVSVSDANLPTCFDTAMVMPLEPRFSCPENTSQSLSTDASLTTFTGGVVNGRYSFAPDEDLSCWLTIYEDVPNERFYDRFTFSNNAPLTAGPEIYSFYLFANTLSGTSESSTIGAVFRSGENDEIDCCNLVNRAPVDVLDVTTVANPIIGDSLYPDSLNLVQQFSVLLNPQEQYTLVTTTWANDTINDYQWFVVAPNGSTFQTNDPFVQTQSDTGFLVSYQLYTFHRDDVMAQANGMNIDSPTFFDGCTNAYLTPRDSILDESCSNLMIRRTYDLVINDSIQDEVCTQIIELDHLGINAAVFPPQNYQFNCSDVFPTLPNGNPHPDFTGRPAVLDTGLTIFLSETPYEGLAAFYSDRDSIREDGGRNIYRDWFIVDQCTTDDTLFTQLFKLEFPSGAILDCPVSNHYCPILEENIMLFSTNPFDCIADVEIPLPALLNFCDTFSWTIQTTVFQLDTLLNGTADTIEWLVLNEDDNRLWSNVPFGDYFILYTATHPEEDQLQRVCRIRVADLTDPTPICRGHIDLSLAGNGSYRLFAPQIDLGSYDNCPDFELSVRRNFFNLEGSCLGPADTIQWSDWGSFVDFSCCDVGDLITVQLQIVDVAGNTNFCSSTVLVNDNTLPFCTNLPDVTISCDSLPNEYALTDTSFLAQFFGLPEVVDNCSAYAIEQTPQIIGDECNPERIIRRFLAIDEHGNVANNVFTQVIDVIPSLSYAIHFPKDTETDCLFNADSLRIEGSGCDNFEVEFSDEILDNQDDECLRIARTYVVTNLCEWNGIDPTLELSRDPYCNGLDGSIDQWIIRTNDTAYLDADSLFNNDFPLAGATNCTLANPVGYLETVNATGRWSYTQIITIYNDQAPQQMVSYQDSLFTDSLDCGQDVFMIIDIQDACYFGSQNIAVQIDLDNDGVFEQSFVVEDEEITGQSPNYNFHYYLPIGEHTIRVTANGSCGTSSTVDYPINVFDAYVPTLQCLDYQLFNLEALAEPTDIDNDGELEEATVFVSATQLGSCLYEDCSEDLIFTLVRPGNLPTLDQGGLYLDCGDRYQVALDLYVWDDAFNPLSIQPDGSVGGRNWRRCEVIVWLQDPDQACNNCPSEQSITLGGTALAWGGHYLQNITAVLSPQNQTTATNGNGRFTFVVESGQDHSISASKNDDTAKGISTLDILLLQAHLLDNLPIVDPHLLVAADVNNDGQINVMDMLELQLVLIGANTHFTNNTSWVFVPANWDGSLPRPEGISYTDLQSCVFDSQLRGIKIGDLNGSYFASAEFSSLANSRSNNEIEIPLWDQEVKKGMTIEVAMPLPTIDAFAGGQMSLQWNERALEYIGYESAVVHPANINLNSVDRGQLHFNYLVDQIVDFNESQASKQSLKLHFKASSNGKLSELLGLNFHGALANEFYQVGTFTPHAISLVWGKESLSPATVIAPVLEGGDYALNAQVTPNPFTNRTSLNIESQQEAKAQLVISDLTGRQIWQQEVELLAGANAVQLNTSNWLRGVYVYRIELQEKTWQGLLMKQ